MHPGANHTVLTDTSALKEHESTGNDAKIVTENSNTNINSEASDLVVDAMECTNVGIHNTVSIITSDEGDVSAPDNG